MGARGLPKPGTAATLTTRTPAVRAAQPARRHAMGAPSVMPRSAPDGRVSPQISPFLLRWVGALVRMSHVTQGDVLANWTGNSGGGERTGRRPHGTADGG